MSEGQLSPCFADYLRPCFAKVFYLGMFHAHSVEGNVFIILYNVEKSLHRNKNFSVLAALFSQRVTLVT